MQSLIEILERLGSPRVLLVGDFMLDRYVYGDVERINPEAPVPILRIVRRNSSVGGAGNVAAAGAAMGGQITCLGVVGDDGCGEELCTLLAAAGAVTSSLVRLKDRLTPVKTRYVGLAQHRHPQQMLRVDEESLDALPDKVHRMLLDEVERLLSDTDIVTIEDYNKGVFSDQSTPRIIARARGAGKAVIVDPACMSDYRRYRGTTLLKPNRYEASLASGIEITDDATMEKAARRLVEITDAQAVAITLDKEGAYLYRRDGGGKRIQHRRPRSVYDVSGAGDESLAVLSVALAGGCSYENALELANVAGGLEVERFGFVPIRRGEMVDELRRMMGIRVGKLMDRQSLAGEIARRRSMGHTIVFTNGCFDVLHSGHVRYLRQACQLGHCLVVAINSDASVRRLKGQDRPIVPQDQRAEMLASLECVDYVTIFDEDTARQLIELLKPEVMAKGGSTQVVVEKEIVQAYGGKVLTLDLVEDQSTTDIIQKIRQSHPDTKD